MASSILMDQISSCELRVSRCGLRVSCCAFRVAGLVFQNDLIFTPWFINGDSAITDDLLTVLELSIEVSALVPEEDSTNL